MTTWMLGLLGLYAKFLVTLSRLSGRGQGTSLPGLLFEKHYPQILSDLLSGYEEIIFITGTNGKTTTRALLNDIYDKNQVSTVTNVGGANLLRGLISSLLMDRDLLGRNSSQVAILEVEEASLPKLTSFAKPSIMVFTNIFRDQLDAYGEIDKTLSYFTTSLENLGYKKKPSTEESSIAVYSPSSYRNQSLDKTLLSTKRPLVFLNMDDKKLAAEITEYDAKFIGFKIDTAFEGRPDFEETDKTIKDYPPSFTATNIISHIGYSSFTIKLDNNNEYLIETKLSGIYNIYNVLTAFLIGFTRFQKLSLQSIRDFQPVFGRGEEFAFEDKKIKLFLVKNPAGFNQLLDLVGKSYESTNPANIIIGINDNIADGRDVSWLWDVDFEKFYKDQPNSIFSTSGSRGLDMLIRLQSAGYKLETKDYSDNWSKVVSSIQESTKEEFIILVTYTSLLQLRAEFSKYVKLPPISKKGY